MEKYWVKEEVDIANLAIQAGCGAILESMFWVLANERDSIILPGPVYPNFFVDAYIRCNVNIQIAKTKLENDYDITEESLEEAYQFSLANGS